MRVTTCNNAQVNLDGDFVLYWMTAFRRVSWNFSLDRAVDWARELQKPLLVLEALRCDYPWASDRLHAFVLEGMADNARALANSSADYYPYVERTQGEGKGLLESLSLHACVIITDDFPCFFIPAMTKTASGKVAVLMEKVDGNGLLPLSLSEKAFLAAYHFRRFSQKHLLPLLNQQPKARPFAGLGRQTLRVIPQNVAEKWPALSFDPKNPIRTFVNTLPIDHHVQPVKDRGGTGSARSAFGTFMESRLSSYKKDRSHPDLMAESGLSPYLHFGHISSHEVVKGILERQAWSPEQCSDQAKGQREGWWGMDENAEAFLDQIITWRELGFQFCYKRPDYHVYESLPKWAIESLQHHAEDHRPFLYTLQEFEGALTHDSVWNAAQNQLLKKGRIHNYLRMLWGKKILHWSATPREALQTMENLNNRYALDGRDPNSYTGIFWILGRHDRAWGPERAVFGKVRYMTSASTQRKLRMKEYLRKFAVNG
ncbi:MAG TPA: deoxyribodipyrimidine photolyase [Deltaproteobacteria bacterium]|nr:deoxyribodipyrimidine photolyase [Deltaproteobacteria bacterium]HIJ39577.1 deoxyribodipyrimidine photolyase [Deltaproteobacteria bacterium]